MTLKEGFERIDVLANFKTVDAEYKVFNVRSDPHMEKTIRSLENGFLSRFKAVKKKRKVLARIMYE